MVSATLPLGRRYVGTIATYSCSPGYQLVGGSSQRACGPNGTWNGTEKYCRSEVIVGTIIQIGGLILYTEISCDVTEISRPTDGQVFIDGAIAFFSCNVGYNLVGSTDRICNMSSGEWSSINPTCSGEQEIAIYIHVYVDI